MQDFISGQRWINSAELNKGLGTVIAVEHRTVTLLFPATGEQRTYAKQSAPLMRVCFSEGDHIVNHEDAALTIVSITDIDGLMTYRCLDENKQIVDVEEGQLSDFLQLNRPIERLMTGQIDSDHWFEMRYQTLLQLNTLSHSALHGFVGCRTSLIPHQMYVAHEVANRFAPRVLLADEVGLGKTIEAGLILHHQLLTERAKRILIIVPDSLVHQWLVEMLRRFNLFFSIFDETRCVATEHQEQDNPFHTQQLVLCHLSFLVDNPKRLQQALAGEWDLLVVDEAHHLQWSAEAPSPEYALIEQLAAQTKGVLLLTATPEQLGKMSHFARLRLLDPDRFPDFERFIEEEKHYEPIAQAVEVLLSDAPVDAETRSALAKTLQGVELLTEKRSDRLALVEHLVDRHGTGRILFRNTRATVKGFPSRQLCAYPLPKPASYIDACHCPEQLWEATDDGLRWVDIDPRVEWLGKQLKDLKPEKVLVITVHQQSAIDLVYILKARYDVHAALFHEDLSLVERDRAAAYFADEYGSQVLVCSEIGSEGRNFQFSHHMVLFDLPLSPDLLEQRIGRLDRIGQTETIHIHVPYLEDSAQATLFHWYHEGLNAFEQTCPVGYTVRQQVESTLIQALDDPSSSIETLIQETQDRRTELNDALHKGRDRLLEYHSCRPGIAQALTEEAEDQDDSLVVADYMEAVFDVFGIHSELQNDTCFIIKPTEHLREGFATLIEEGMSITYQRDTALSNEDVQYLTWEHPLVRNAMETISTHELGNTAVTAIAYQGVEEGTLLLECLYVLEAAANLELQTARYLPATTIRVVVDEHGENHSAILSHYHIKQNRSGIEVEIANQVVKTKQDVLESMMSHCDRLADEQTPDILSAALTQTMRTLNTEIERLKALKRVNRNVRDEEIVYFQAQLHAVTQIVQVATPRLDAVRVIVAIG